MTQLLARIMLALLMLPLASLVYLLAFAFIESELLHRDEQALLVAGVVSAVFVAVYWVLLWHRTVRWTEARVWATIGAPVLAVAISLALGAWMGMMVEEELGIFVGTATAILLWLVGTVFAWRETAAERAARFGSGQDGSSAIACPHCGYNLTGLASTQCPECGARFTLDELIAARRADAEIDG